MVVRRSQQAGVDALAVRAAVGRAQLERCLDEERAVDLELSIGDFVVSGGELPALLLIDAIVRQLPGVLNDAQSNVDSLKALIALATSRPGQIVAARRTSQSPHASVA